MNTLETKKNIKILSGTVVSDKMAKTVVVLVKRFIKHPKYQKYIIRSKKYKAHDENKIARIGDKVSIKSSRPLSRDKHFVLIEVNGAKV